MSQPGITEEMIFACIAAAKPESGVRQAVQSFFDVEAYENLIMHPEFARWADKAREAELARLFRKVAGEEKLHAVWLCKLYADIGVPRRGGATQRAIHALDTIRANCDALPEQDPQGVVERALRVAISVEEREYRGIYPAFRDQALAESKIEAVAVYQRVVDSAAQHAAWFRGALNELQVLAFGSSPLNHPFLRCRHAGRLPNRSAADAVHFGRWAGGQG